MEFVPGKYYQTRGGKKAAYMGINPLCPSGHDKHVFAIDGGSVYATSESGHGAKDSWDIIAEWQEPLTVTRWWFGYVLKSGGDAAEFFQNREEAEQARKSWANSGYRVGPVKEDSTVVP